MRDHILLGIITIGLWQCVVDGLKDLSPSDYRVIGLEKYGAEGIENFFS